MSIVAIAALNFAAVRAMFDSTLDLSLLLATLPMANVSAVSISVNQR